MFGRRRLACSFCGKGEAEVAKLVAGPKVFICDQCVAVADRIMKQDSGEQAPAAEAQSGLLRRVMKGLSKGGRQGAHLSGEGAV